MRFFLSFPITSFIQPELSASRNRCLRDPVGEVPLGWQPLTLWIVIPLAA